MISHVMKNDNQNTIKLMGERRIKTFALGMILIMIILIPYISFLIHYEEADNLILYMLLFGLHGLTIVGNVYLLFNTESKLLKAQLLQGIFTIVLALTVFMISLFILFDHEYGSITLCSVLFVLLLVLLRWVLIKINYHNFRKSAKFVASFIFYIIGIGIGRVLYEYIKNCYGESITQPVAILCLFAVSVLFGFLGVFCINRYLLACKAEYRVEYMD